MNRLKVTFFCHLLNQCKHFLKCMNRVVVTHDLHGRWIGGGSKILMMIMMIVSYNLGLGYSEKS